MRRHQVVTTLVLLVCAADAMAGVAASSRFDADLQGWYETGTASSSPVSWNATGGNPDGYLRFEDDHGATPFVEAPNAFLGSWTDMGVTALSWDHRLFSLNGGAIIYSYEAQLSGPGGSAKWIGNQPVGVTDWTSVVAPVSQDDWSMMSGSWSSLLSNVTGLRLRIELVSNSSQPGDIAGIDNVVLENNVPEPTTLAIWGIFGGLGLIAARRRRRVV